MKDSWLAGRVGFCTEFSLAFVDFESSLSFAFCYIFFFLSHIICFVLIQVVHNVGSPVALTSAFAVSSPKIRSRLHMSASDSALQLVSSVDPIIGTF